MEGSHTEQSQVLMACKIFQQQGLFDGFGHVTMRLTRDRVLSTPKMPPGKVTMRDFIVVNLANEKLDGIGEVNGETPMHTAIYRARPDVNCILHYHPDELIAVSVSGQSIKVVGNCGAWFYQGTPLYDSPILITSDELGDKVAETLGDRTTLLLRGHGATVVADDIEELIKLGINLVKTARIQMMASSLGDPKVHSEEEARSIVEGERRSGVIRRFVDYYLSETVD